MDVKMTQILTLLFTWVFFSANLSHLIFVKPFSSSCGDVSKAFSNYPSWERTFLVSEFTFDISRGISTTVPKLAESRLARGVSQLLCEQHIVTTYLR